MSSSFRSVKRHLSSHRSKSPLIPDDSAGDSVMPQVASRWNSPWDRSLGLSELPHEVPHYEMAQGECETNITPGRSELHATESSSPWSASEGGPHWCQSYYSQLGSVALSYDQEQQRHHLSPTHTGIHFSHESQEIATYDNQPDLWPNARNTQDLYSERSITEEFDPEAAELDATSVGTLANNETPLYSQHYSPPT